MRIPQLTCTLEAQLLVQSVTVLSDPSIRPSIHHLYIRHVHMYFIYMYVYINIVYTHIQVFAQPNIYVRSIRTIPLCARACGSTQRINSLTNIF